MVRKRTLFIICLALTGLILMVNFYIMDQRILAIATLLPVGLMLYSGRVPQKMLAHLSLVAFTILSAAGVLLNTALMTMILASTVALASWDLALEMHLEYPATSNYEKHHLLYLGIALGLGLVGIGALHWIQLELPFVGVLALVIILLVLLNQVMNRAQNDRGLHR